MTVPATSKAIVQTGERTLELRELPVPQSVAPDEGLLKLDLDIDAQIRPAPGPAPAMGSAPEQLPEQIVERPAERRPHQVFEVVEAAGSGPAAAVLERGVAHPVIGRPLLRVRQDRIGLVDVLEPRLGVRAVGIAVGVVLHGELAERRLQLFVGRAALHAKNVVIIAVGHRVSAPPSFRSR